MKQTSTQIISPQLAPSQMSEMEVLGSVVWLWMHSERHTQAPLFALNHLLLPAIKLGQYALIIDNAKPIAFASWAGLSERFEAEYLHSFMRHAQPEDWNSGERKWITDWVAPFGHSLGLMSVMRRQLFPSDVMRTLYHKGISESPKILELHGIAVPAAEAKHWFATHPIQHMATNCNN